MTPQDTNTNIIPVACFAPPMTDAKLARYEVLIDAHSERETREALQMLLACVKAWWEIEPVSKRTPARWTITHHDKNSEYAETPLEAEHVAALDDVTPWQRDLDAIDPLILLIQANEAYRNGVKLDAWKTAVRQALIAESFTPEELAWLSSGERRVMRRVFASMGSSEESVSQDTIDKVLAAFGTSMEKINNEAARMKAVETKLAAISNGEDVSPVPKPALESTELRDAAKHLFWFAGEITRDREPLTTEVLPVA